MDFLVEELEENNKFKEIIQDIKNRKNPVNISGLCGMAKIHILGSIYNVENIPMCIITYNELQAKSIIENLKVFNDNILYFPKREIVSYDYDSESKESLYERIEVLNNINDKKAKIIVTTVEAIMQKMISQEELYKNIIEFKIGETYKLDIIKEKLIELGYERKDLIEGRGEFSLRGGILDIAQTERKGIRIEFWGDDVDSIREFSIASQRSTKMLDKITVYPAHEFVLEKNTNEVIHNIKAKYENIKNVNQDIELIQTGNYYSKIDKYFNCFYSNSDFFINYLDDNFYIVIDEIEKVEQRKYNIIKETKNLISLLTEKEKFVPEEIRNIVDDEYNINNRNMIYITESDNIKSKYNWKSYEIKFYKSEMQILSNTIKSSVKDNKKIVILAGNEENCKKIKQFLEEEKIESKFIQKVSKLESGKVIITFGMLDAGFVNEELNLVVISSSDFLNVDHKRKKTTNAFREGEKIVFADLKMYDYVVHRTNGIGQFIGVKTITADNVTKDYIKIKYQNEDILYVPTTSLDSVRKYIGGEENPRINKLGSKEWENQKAKVKRNLQAIAKDLIQLYAKRQKITGYAFSKDTVWQKQFEDSFPYNETEDQLRCIEEVKRDMETPKPMDRLLCGDVGYGKTEVAIRAAFKAVIDQKQVAYLVPTTVLANQQYESFKERMKDFPINVELLNRFRTKKEQNEVIRKLKLGEVDIIIGTHRILSKDVEYKDLGLLIIDEEHRFGVKAKEKIKKLKTNIDVLTMTATPIPRTLHMSVVGVRDMSVIYEPPQNRKPVQTYVLEYDKEIVQEAITRELERNGQVFYLFNNVENIERKVNEIEKLVPEAKVGFAHGKMPARQLEEIMEKFIVGDINVLICTTILESGIDIPNANTIIVENADRLGLAQLYQIRGRVGRADKQAYAFVMYKRDKILSEVADKRLKAIKEFTEFGSGFKIAMRDLEIRGAGSLLGEIQSGHMEQVGYDTYCKLLDEVIKETKGIKVEQEKDIQIEVDISSYIPEEYIENSSQKIEIYQDIALTKTEEDIQNVIDEIIDRYGQMPKEVENLMEVARIKQLCKKASIDKLIQRKDNVVFYFDSTKFNINIIDELIKKYKNRVKFSPGKIPYITIKIENSSSKQIFKEIKEFLSNIK